MFHEANIEMIFVSKQMILLALIYEENTEENKYARERKKK